MSALSAEKPFDPVTFRYHALRILCGALMDRRTLCPFPHPFCGPSHQEYGHTPIQLIVHANVGTDDTRTMEFVDLFLCRATTTSLEGLEVKGLRRSGCQAALRRRSSASQDPS